MGNRFESIQESHRLRVFQAYGNQQALYPIPVKRASRDFGTLISSSRCMLDSFLRPSATPART